MADQQPGSTPAERAAARGTEVTGRNAEHDASRTALGAAIAAVTVKRPQR